MHEDDVEEGISLSRLNQWLISFLDHEGWYSLASSVWHGKVGKLQFLLVNGKRGCLGQPRP